MIHLPDLSLKNLTPRRLMTFVYYITLLVEAVIMFSIDLTVRPDQLNMNHWLIALIITAKALTVLGWTLWMRRWG